MVIDSQTQRLTTNPPIAMDIDEDTKSSSILKAKLTTIFKRVVYISIASAILVVLLLTARFCISKYVVEERSFSLADIQYFGNFGRLGISFLLSIGILTIHPLWYALKEVRYIKKDVIYGRYIGDALKKFLQCHLTVYIVVGTVLIIGYVVFQDNPLGWSENRLLWLFIIDIVVSIALATDISAEYRDIRKTKTLFSKFLAKNIIGHAIYQIAAILILFLAPKLFVDIDDEPWAPLHAPPSKHFTIIFNTFCLMTLFNAFNFRKIQREHNIFKGLFNNPIFCAIITILFILHIFIVQYSSILVYTEEADYGDGTSPYDDGDRYYGLLFTASLNLIEWEICLAFGLGELLWGQIITAIPPRQ